ncbi:serine--pyruvate aminotransferase [Halobacteriales archaeon QH_10_67_13]|nr:MAG: serine--pyruvate aminotransferase [Halobacteriales archaeon QH_10_67_13]
MASTDTQAPVLERVGYRLSRVVERWMPSPFLFAILLTYGVFVAGVGLGQLGMIGGADPDGPVEMVELWYGGFWDFLGFSMQMALILMTGFALAYHPRANDLLVWLAERARSARQAVALVAAFSMAVAWIHWGFSLILGAIFAREMGKVAHQRDIDVHYPLLCVAGYMGLGLTWHWGLSGSAPLLLTDASAVGEGTAFDMLSGTIPASETILHPYGIALTALSVGFAALVLVLITPSGERARGITEYIPEEELFGTETDGGSVTRQTAAVVPAELVVDVRDRPVVPDPGTLGLARALLGRVQHCPGPVAAGGVGYIAWLFVTEGRSALALNVVNFGFLMAGLLLWTNPAAYREKFGEAATAAAGIVLLFPFFAGLQGMMAGSGLAGAVADGLIDLSTEGTFPVFAWLTAAVVNLFVPSGGGEWIVLGPSVLEAAQNVGVEPAHATMAYAVGDAHTNLLNPFWAIPLLAITRIKAREMFGYAVVMLLALIPFLAAVLFLLPYGFA